MDVLYDVGRMAGVVDSQHLANIHSQSQEVIEITSVDLNLHLMNQNGNLVAWGNDYIVTCTPQGFACFGSSFFIFADCWQGDGNIISTSYDVNKNVQNNNGFLASNNC